MAIKENPDKIRFKIQNSRIKHSLIFCVVFLMLVFLFPSYGLTEEKSIGVIMTGDIAYYRDMHNAFISKINKEGYGNKVKIMMQKPFPEYISMRNAVRKLIAMDVDIIVTYGTPAIIAAIDEKPKIPVVYVSAYDPLIASLRAKNITGISIKSSVSSLLRYLRGVRSFSNLGVVYSTHEQDTVYQLNELRRFSGQYGFRIEEINLKSAYDLKDLSSNLLGVRPDAIFITSSSIANTVMPAITSFSRERKIPTASLLPDKKNMPVIALYAVPESLGRVAAEKVINLIEGDSPENIKRDSIYEVELVVNMKEALSLGLSLPMELVTEATRLVQ